VELKSYKSEQWIVKIDTPAQSSAPYAVSNIGYGSPMSLMNFVKAIEGERGIEAQKPSKKCRQVVCIKLMQILKIYS
tara:strand:+ start:12083 stop:12313 length:231 start_codon:yes stop_codon:yes gene_type:complete